MKYFIAALFVVLTALAVGCSKKDDIKGSLAFVLGGTSVSSSSLSALQSPSALAGTASNNSLVSGDEYIVSPSKAKITFTSIVYKDSTGQTLGTSTFTDCTVTYDRSLTSGATLLDCPFTAPVGDVYQ